MDINNIYIKDMSELADILIDDAMGLSDVGSVVAVGYYEDISWLLKELLQYDEVMVGSIELEDFTMGGYDAEYILFLNEGLVVSVERAKSKNGIATYYKSPVVYIGEDCSSSIVLHNIDSEATTYAYGFCDEEDGIECSGDCENCELGFSTDEDDNNDNDYMVIVGKYSDLTPEEKNIVDLFLDWRL